MIFNHTAAIYVNKWALFIWLEEDNCSCLLLLKVAELLC